MKILFGAIVVVVVIAFMLVSNKKGGSEIAPPTTEQGTYGGGTEPTLPAQTEDAAITSVAITSSGFEPATVNIDVGGKVEWMNKSGEAATVNSALHPTHSIYPQLNLNEVPVNGSVSLVFDTPGTYKYHDHLNPSRTGTVEVK